MQVILNNKMGSAVKTIKDSQAFQLLGTQTPAPPPPPPSPPTSYIKCLKV